MRGRIDRGRSIGSIRAPLLSLAAVGLFAAARAEVPGFAPSQATGGASGSALIEVLKARSIPVVDVTEQGGVLGVRLDYPAEDGVTADRVKGDILEVFRQMAATAGPAGRFRMEAAAAGSPVFDLEVAPSDARDLAEGRIAEPEFLARVARTDRDTPAEFFQDIPSAKGERLPERSGTEGAEWDRWWAENRTPSDGNPRSARLLLLAAGVTILGLATLLIFLLARWKGPPEAPGTKPARPWYAVALPAILALGSAGLLAFAAMVWNEDGLFDADLETLSAWLCAAAGAAAALSSFVLFRRARSRATHIVAALSFLLVLPVLFAAFIYLGDQVFISTEDMFFRGDICERGAYGPKNEREAAKWFLKAAGRGDVRAMERLAAMYEEGRGVPSDPARAEEWRLRARGSK